MPMEINITVEQLLILELEIQIALTFVIVTLYLESMFTLMQPMTIGILKQLQEQQHMHQQTHNLEFALISHMFHVINFKINRSFGFTFITSTYIFYCISLFIRSKDEIEIQLI